MRALLDLLGASADAFGLPIQVEGRLVGLLVARMTAGASETRRLATVLAGQASVLIGQLELELADEHGGLACEDSREASRLGCAGRHPRHEQTDEPTFDLDRKAEGVGRRAQQIQ